MGSMGLVRAPQYRTLRGFAFDPSLSLRLDTAVVNAMTYRVPWEELEPGPVGEYVEVIDVDPTSDVIYPPVDLSHPHVLAPDGLGPSEGNPQFHQQMVYAVAMTTIRNFERALGRRSPLGAAARHARRTHRGRSTSRGCASIRTRCARRTPTTARPRRRCCSATSRRAA